MEKKPEEEILLKRINQTLRKTIDTQIYNSDPPETAETMERLITEGFDEDKAYELIGRVISEQLAEVIEKKEEFDMDSYIRALERLPEPFLKDRS